MPVWLRRGALVLLVAGSLGVRAKADAISSSGSDWTWWALGSGSGPQSGSTPPAVTNAAAEVATPPPAPAPAPAPAATPAPAPAPAPAATTEAPMLGGTASLAATTSPSLFTTSSTPATADGFINFGSGPYPGASSIASGAPQAWYNSSEVAGLFGGQPTAQQRQDFTNTVLQRVEQTFSQSGVSVNLTTDPTVSAAHTLSVVSNSTSVPFPNSIGTTAIGGNGFSFIDQEAKASSTVDQLEWIVAHNVSHELMLAFGVPEAYDQTGKYVDSTTGSWSMMTSPAATFSPSASQAINQALAQAATESALSAAQNITAAPVPEPATVALWGAAAGLFGLRNLRARGQRPRA